MFTKLKSLPTALSLAGITLGLALGSSPALASTASVSFTSFAYSTTGGSLVWATGDAYQTLFASASEAGGSGGLVENAHEAENWLPGGISAATASASSSAAVGAGPTLSILATASPVYVSEFAYPHGAFAFGGLSGAFNLTAAGSVTFDVGYQVQVSAPGGNLENDFASAVAQFSVGNYDSGGGVSVTLEQFSYDHATGIGDATGTFSLTLNIGSAGDTGYFNLMGNALVNSPASVVPEPGQAALLLAGLGGIGFWLRRRRPRD